MRQLRGTLRLTWRAELQIPFESGWSIFQKLMTLNNLEEREFVQLITRENVPYKEGRLRNRAGSSWIDFQRLGDLLNMPPSELKNGFWDQLGIELNGPARNNIRLCKKCWDQLRYHCILFDLVWMDRCPWHGCPITQSAALGRKPLALLGSIGQRSSRAFNLLLNIPPVSNSERYRITGFILEYLEWWQAIKSIVPAADKLLSSLVTTEKNFSQYSSTVGWQAGFAKSRVPILNSSWILADVVSTPCNYAIVIDAGRIPTTLDNRATIKDDVGCVYRSIRRHVFRRYVRHHRSCLARLAQLSRNDLLSLVADGICATCLAYIIWRMSIENLMIMEGLYTQRRNNFRLRLIDPWLNNPSDDRARLSFTYMQFFGIWAALSDSSSTTSMRIAKHDDTISSPQILFALDEERPSASPLRVLHCVYPLGDDIAARTAHPGKSPWTLLPMELESVIRREEWRPSWTQDLASIVQVYLRKIPDVFETMKEFRL